MSSAPPKSPPTNPKSALATALGAAGAFFLTPYLHDLIELPLEDFLEDRYAYSLIWLAGPLAWVGPALIVFFGVRAAAPILFKLLGLKLAQFFSRFL